MNGRLEGKVALITGASQGIGRASAIALAKEGAEVAVTARSRADLDRLVSEIEAAGGHAFAAAGDASLEEDVERIRRETLARFPGWISW